MSIQYFQYYLLACQTLKNCCNKSVRFSVFSTRENQFVLVITSKDWFNVICFLKQSSLSRYQVLIDLVAIDYPNNQQKRFQLVCCLLSITYNSRIFVKVFLSDQQLLQSLVSLFPGAVWYERQVWDMFGIMFRENPDLRRILSDYGFKGHAYRKCEIFKNLSCIKWVASSKRVINQI